MTDDAKKVRIGRLDTIGGVITEMGRVYRQARRKELDTLDANRLVGILAQIRTTMELSEIEERMRALEGRHGG